MSEKKRVAAYCRVSSNLEGQQSSIELQKQVYAQKIDTNPDWELVAVYSDEGATGTNVKKRFGFLQMMSDASEGLIDVIVTKSISRFARNTLECLESIRELQEYGVQLIFEKEGITTGEAFSEMILTIMAAFAQEESRSLSENLKWGIRKRYEQGIDRWVCVYGYTSSENGKYQIVPEEAEVVRAAFKLYDSGKSMGWIADYFTKQGIPSPGRKRWDASNISVFLNNEKYVGDIRLQKKYTVDHIEHKEIINDGKVPSYYIKKHHTPIIDRKTYDRVQVIKSMRMRGKNQEALGHIQYPFGEHIRCPHCDRPLIQRKIEIQDAGSYLCCENEACGQFLLLSQFVSKAIRDSYRQLDTKMLTKKLESESEEQRQQAAFALEYKKAYPEFKTLEYFWMDDLIEKVVPGKHTTMPMIVKMLKGKGGYVEDDRTISIYWRCKIKTTVFSGVQKDKDMPQCVQSLFRARQERLQNDEA